jgi:hypothetical protein
MRIPIAMLLVILLTQSLRAGTAVMVSSKCQDPVGQKLVDAVKKGIRKSALLSLSSKENAQMRLDILTIEADPRIPGESTVYSAVITRFNQERPTEPYFLEHFAGNCGSDRLRDCAQTIVATTSEHAAQLSAAPRQPSGPAPKK